MTESRSETRTESRTVTETRTTYLVGRSDRILRAELEDALEPSGLSLSEATVLSVLAARPGLSNAGLARRALVTPQAMHKVIRSLEGHGLIRRLLSPEGGRSLETSITEHGRTVLGDAEDRMAAAEDRFLEGLDDEERRMLRSLLLKVARLDTARRDGVVRSTGSPDDGA